MKEYFKNLMDTKNSFLAPSIILGISIIFFGLAIEHGILNFSKTDKSITVTGSAEKIVKSDMAKWTISVSERSYGENAGINSSKQSAVSINNIKNYLLNNGVDENEITVGASSLTPICELSSQGYENCSIAVRGQIANQNIVVETIDVDKVSDLNGKISTQISGVNISSNYVEYFYNALKDIRVEMLSEATKNARERADAVADAGGADVGNITSLSSGVFQVTQKNSVAIDDYGAYDTSSIDKKITATVKVNFSIE